MAILSDFKAILRDSENPKIRLELDILEKIPDFGSRAIVVSADLDST